MIGKIVWKLFGQKYLLGGLAAIYKVLDGKKTTLATIGIVLVYAAKFLGYLPADVADRVVDVLSGMGAVSLAHKLSKWDDTFKITDTIKEAKTEIQKPLPPLA